MEWEWERPHNTKSAEDWWWVVPVKNCGKHELFADFLRTAGFKQTYHLSNMNNHYPNIINLIRKSLSLSSQETKLKIKFHLYLSDFYHQKVKKYVTWGYNRKSFTSHSRVILWSHLLVVCARKRNFKKWVWAAWPSKLEQYETRE